MCPLVSNFFHLAKYTYRNIFGVHQGCIMYYSPIPFLAEYSPLYLHTCFVFVYSLINEKTFGYFLLFIIHYCE